MPSPRQVAPQPQFRCRVRRLRPGSAGGCKRQRGVCWRPVWSGLGRCRITHSLLPPSGRHARPCGWEPHSSQCCTVALPPEFCGCVQGVSSHRGRVAETSSFHRAPPPDTITSSPVGTVAVHGLQTLTHTGGAHRQARWLSATNCAKNNELVPEVSQRMHHSRRYGLVALLLCAAPLLAAAFTCAGNNDPVTCSALGDFYIATSGDSWSELFVNNHEYATFAGPFKWQQAANGAATDYCSFEGVNCGGTTRPTSMCVAVLCRFGRAVLLTLVVQKSRLCDWLRWDNPQYLRQPFFAHISVRVLGLSWSNRLAA